MNNKGISSIIATLILILLTIVLIGIVWIVASNIVGSGAKQATVGAQCFNSAVQVMSASCNTSTYCNVSVQRTSGTDIISGVRLVFMNATTTGVSDLDGNIQTLASSSISVNTGVKNISEIDAAIYFNDSAGNKNPCSGIVKFTTINQLSP